MVEAGVRELKSKQSGLPPGWSLRYASFKNFLTAPNGRVFQGRINAIRYMEEERYPEAHIENMIGSLTLDGWNYDENLPTGWMFMRKKGSKYFFLTDDMEIIESSKKAHETMAIQQNEEGLAKFGSFLKFWSRTQGQKDKDSALPAGWTTEKGNFGKISFHSPCGLIFPTRSSALKFMVEQRFPENEIARMVQCLEYEGWREDHRLPKGWRLRESLRVRRDQFGTEKKVRTTVFLTDKGEEVSSSRALELYTVQPRSEEEVELFRLVHILELIVLH